MLRKNPMCENNPDPVTIHDPLPASTKHKLEISRFCYAETGTFGIMYVAGYKLYTVEQPWNGNKRGESCIPEGLYRCEPTYYHKGKYRAVEILNVPGGRTRILFHRANWPRQLQGCIAPVSDWTCVQNEIGGPDSRTAFGMFMEHHGSAPFDLKIDQYLPKDMTLTKRV